MRTVIRLFTLFIYLALNPFVHSAVADGHEHDVSIDTKIQDEPASTAAEIDMQHVQRLRNKQQRGETLTPEEMAYLEKAGEYRRKLREEFKKNNPPRETTGLIPLTDLGKGTYKNTTGGLYPGGENVPPQDHLKAGLKFAGRIVPLDAEGNPSSNGVVVLLSVGMSNTTQEFQVFKKMAEADADMNPRVVLVDGAQGGQSAEVTADAMAKYWEVTNERLTAANVTPKQVQVAWIKQATPGPTRPFPAEVKTLQGYLLQTVQVLANRFPNLKIAYLSNRIYAGFATSALNPEPHAYETAFAVKWLIADQISGMPELNYDSEKGEVRSPWLAWGPNLWADGLKARGDGLTYARDDLGDDGTHPSMSGRAKVAKQLLAFLKTDSTAQPWFVKNYDRPTVEETLTFLRSLPPIHRKINDKPALVQIWKDKTIDDIKTMKKLQFGGHIEGGGHLRIEGDDWKYLTAFEELETANLWEIEGANNTAFYHLGHLSQTVATLNVEVAHEVTAKGIKHLQNLKNLKILGVGWSDKIDDEAVQEIAKIATLEQINVSGCRAIKGPGLESLAKLKHLKTLKLSMSALTDDALANLSGLGVEALDLSKPPNWVKNSPYFITFDGIRNLLADRENLPKLMKLTLKNLKLSDKQVAALQASRSGLEVVQ